MSGMLPPLKGFVAALALGGCESMTDPPPSAPVLHRPTSRTGHGTPVSWQDNIAMYFDTDGDGRADKWAREEWTYCDTNRDGIPDRAEHSLGCGAEWKEDTNFDGWFDTHVTVVGVAALKTEREIHQMVSRFLNNTTPED